MCLRYIERRPQWWQWPAPIINHVTPPRKWNFLHGHSEWARKKYVAAFFIDFVLLKMVLIHQHEPSKGHEKLCCAWLPHTILASLSLRLLRAERERGRLHIKRLEVGKETFWQKNGSLPGGHLGEFLSFGASSYTELEYTLEVKLPWENLVVSM